MSTTASSTHSGLGFPSIRRRNMNLKRVIATGWVVLLGMLLVGSAAAQQSQPSDEIVVVITALSPESTITLGTEPSAVGSTAGLYPGEPLAVEVKGGVKDARE